MEGWNPEDFVQVPCSTGAQIYWHKDFFDPKIREEITKNASKVAAQIGKKHGFRLMTEEEWALEEKEKASCETRP